MNRFKDPNSERKRNSECLESAIKGDLGCLGGGGSEIGGQAPVGDDIMGDSKTLVVDVSMEEEKMISAAAAVSAVSLKETFTEGAQSVSISWINIH